MRSIKVQRQDHSCRLGVSWCQLKRLFLAVIFSSLPILIASYSFAANGYQETAAMWQKLMIQEVDPYSLFLQNFYNEVEAQIGPDNTRLNQEFSMRLAEKYPGSSSFNGMAGILAVNNYTQLTYNTSWKINSIQQTFGGLKKKYDVRNKILQISNGPNSITIKTDLKFPENSLFTSANIPAISVTAQRIWEKKRINPSLPQPLRDILNDAYAYSLAGRDNMRMDKFGALEWKRFETVSAEYLRLIGYDPKETRIGADGGVDIWIYKQGDERPFGIVQCKAWNSYKVGVKPVRELYGVMAAEKVVNGLFITSGVFTSEAIAFAEGKLISMFSGHEFLAKIKSLTEKDQATLLNIATAGDYRTPTCPQCGIKMTLRQGVEGKRAFWGCVKFPKCRATLDIVQI